MSCARFVAAQKKAVRLDVRAEAIVAGTDSGCALVLADAIAAARHCALAWHDGRFTVRDLGSDTGTYRNGLRVVGEEALASGDEIVVGSTRLRVGIADAPEPTLQLQIVAQDVATTPSRSGEFGSDADRWARGEADLARWPALRGANRWAARIVVVGLPLLLLWPRAREALTEPGPLSAGHAALFTAAAAATFPREARRAEEQGCAVCHDAFGGTPDARCAQCHDDLARGHHPFASATDDPSRVRAPLPSDSCAACHPEHHGPELAKPARATSELCADCHGGTALAQAGYATERAPGAVPTAPRAHGGFRFAHQDHAAVDCTHCHRRGDDTGSGRGAEFAPVTFVTCAGCHRKDALDPAVRSEWRPGADQVWTIAWHGSGDGETTCGQCHARGDGAGGFGPARREAVRPAGGAAEYAATRARYRVTPRSHHELLRAADRDCTRCHRAGDRQLAAPAERSFWHELHLSVAPARCTDDASKRALSAECDACHSELAEAGALTDARTGRYACASTAACGGCHREGPRDAGDAPLVPAAVPAQAGAVRQGNEFPHAPHLASPDDSLAAGCLACHEFTPTRDDAPFAVPATTEQARTCLPCHEQHDRIGGGACRNCHGTADPRAYNDFLGQAPPPDRAPAPRPWPVASAFDHFSPGHAPSTEQDCAVCHRGQSALDELRDLAALAAPTEADGACRECHLGERQRFHWR